MKELEKVKRISISSTLFILAVLVGVLAYERPENMYARNTKSTLEDLTRLNYIIPMDKLDSPDVVLVDIRRPYDFEQGHLENAINIPAAEILREENKKIFRKLKDSNKLAVLYGNKIEEANIPFLLLYQLGYDNVKLLSVNNKYLHNSLITESADVEKPVANIRAFIDESVRNATKKEEVKKPAVIPKKVIPVKKKKKLPVEGGC
ncbi:Rhodanese-like domain-containing protein [Salinimicrobium sediminis]|uniref:Rhodanese-like domain-containing protein n=1 Tax=Salinimicrobium sediminis TaxID=1343891 RepID=A0A285X1Q0_9FLAO|nr:rhodanese-like domain-containing protein [Salinimicrobium sediminis]SOC79290.1 Rhodanese-like domain-containing protein [Salinimicrobium sediminis]